MKYMNPTELFTEQGIVLEYGCGKYNNRPVRFLRESGVFQVGDNDFDRWANSVEFEFDLYSKKGQREFYNWVAK